MSKLLRNMLRHLSFMLAILMLSITTAQAGVHSDALGQCFVDSASKEDKNKLIVWMFLTASQHPVLKDMLRVKEADLNKANKELAHLTMKLLTDDCRVKAKKAIRAEGLIALQLSSKIFGEKVGRELFASPYVVKAMAGYARNLDVVTLGLLLAE